MSKMDRQLNSKKDKETIYEIYRACRLCGAGAGYKMPIIQNVVDMDDTEVELRQKVRDCVQIEVHQNDKMPPLICELCVDKVNDFYEFLEMCRQTNKRTRLRLGLPPQSMPRGAPDAGECILGLTEPVYVNDDSDAEPMSKQKKLNPSSKVKREPELLVKLENRIMTDTRTSRLSKRPPTPPRVTRLRANSKDDNVSLSRLKDSKSKSPKGTPKSILKKDTKIEDSSSLSSRLKRSRDKEPVKIEPPTKKVKIAAKPSPPTPKSSPKTSPRVTRPQKPPKVAPKRAPSPARVHKCAVCGQASKTPQANISHMKVHFVSFTSRRLACNPCGLWFASAEEATSHHKNHRHKSIPYTCSRCCTDYRHLSAYDDHFKNNECIPWEEVPDVKCDVCWHLFPTNKLLEDHRCLGEEHRPGGKCGKCNRSYALLRNLKKHELTCTAKKKGDVAVDPELLRKCRPFQIRTSRCDSLLTNVTREHYDVSNVTADFGLDKNCVYPYISSVSRLRIKSDPEDLDRMVSIGEGIKDEFYTAEDYIHWDSEDTDSDGEGSCSLVLASPFAKKKNVSTLANITLKTLFSQRCLGKVPKKKRRVKEEKMFDSLLNETEDDVTRDINNIIDNLGDDDDVFDSESGDGNLGNREETKDSVIDKEVNDTNKSIDISDDTGSNIIDKDAQDYRSDVKENNDENAQSDVKFSDENDISDEVSKQDDRDSATLNLNSVSNNTTVSNNNLCTINDNNDEITRIDDKFNNSTINSTNEYDNDTQATSKKENDANINDNSLESGKDENQNDGTEMRNDAAENSQDSNSVGAVSESILNDSTQSDVGSEHEKESIDKVNINTINDNATSLPEQTSDVGEFKSQPNLFSTAILSSKMAAIDVIKPGNRSQVNDDYSHVNENEDDYKNAISVIVNNSKKSRNGTDDDSELDDSKLMADLDAQIGESNDNSRGQVNDNSNDKIALEDLISSKSQEMDTMTEDFNFDT